MYLIFSYNSLITLRRPQSGSLGTRFFGLCFIMSHFFIYVLILMDFFQVVPTHSAQKISHIVNKLMNQQCVRILAVEEEEDPFIYNMKPFELDSKGKKQLQDLALI